jgi:hypothetical protein
VADLSCCHRQNLTGPGWPLPHRTVLHFAVPRHPLHSLMLCWVGLLPLPQLLTHQTLWEPSQCMLTWPPLPEDTTAMMGMAIMTHYTLGRSIPRLPGA